MQSFRFSFRRLAVFTGILVLFLLIVEFNTRLEELNRLTEQRDALRARATQASQTQIALQTKVAYARSDAAVEEWARTEGHYIKEGDQPVVPLSVPGSEPIVLSTPTALPTPMQNWEIWWNLFFDE